MALSEIRQNCNLCRIRNVRKYNLCICFTLYVFAFVLVEQDYDTAIKLYTDAINLFPFNASYYGNRSFAYIKTECYGYGLADANKALELDKSYVKVGTKRTY